MQGQTPGQTPDSRHPLLGGFQFCNRNKLAEQLKLVVAKFEV